VIAALNRAGVRYVLVGGLASGAHGVVRATRDVDLVPAPEAENLGALAVVLTALGARHPIQDRLSADNLAAPSSIKLETDHGEVHVLNRMPGTPPFGELEAQAPLLGPSTNRIRLRAPRAAGFLSRAGALIAPGKHLAKSSLTSLQTGRSIGQARGWRR